MAHLTQKVGAHLAPRMNSTLQEFANLVREIALLVRQFRARVPLVAHHSHYLLADVRAQPARP